MHTQLSSSGYYVPTPEDLAGYNAKNHLIHSKQINTTFLSHLFAITEDIKKGKYNKEILKDKIAGVLFYESSTRTRFSFESAVLRLGGGLITTENAAQFSSAAKGESIFDTIRMLNTYADLIILRTGEDMAPYQASSVSEVPYLNAGSGKTQHPTQAILDVFTIYEKFGKVDGLEIVIAGDLNRGRTVDSLVFLLSKYPNNMLHFVSPENSRIKDSLREHLKENNISFTESTTLEEHIRNCDVCYMTRIQKERFNSEEEYNEAKGKVMITLDLVRTMKKDGIILHPLPRLDEIETTVDTTPHAWYFKQSENGLYTRMALLTMMFDKGMEHYSKE